MSSSRSVLLQLFGPLKSSGDISLHTREMLRAWKPTSVAFHPVTIIGGGVQGKRLALMWASQGGSVHVIDPMAEQRKAVEAYVDAGLDAHVRKVAGKRGSVHTYPDLASAELDQSWLVIEAIPERLSLKRELFAALDQQTHPDCILATNSSSYVVGEMHGDIKYKHRAINAHCFWPPEVDPLELMGTSETPTSLIEFMMQQGKRHGFRPFHVKRESTGLMFNRIWAAIKREALMVVEEGVATAEEVDEIFAAVLGAKTVPMRQMDVVGIDTVLAIEEHYAQVRQVPETPRKLLRQMIADGKLGEKNGQGFYKW